MGRTAANETTVGGAAAVAVGGTGCVIGVSLARFVAAGVTATVAGRGD